MVHSGIRTILGRPYRYASRSIRLPDGRVATLTARYAENVSLDEIRQRLDELEVKRRAAYAAAHYRTLRVRVPDALVKLERARLAYKRILKTLSAAAKRDLFDRFTVNFTYESNALEGNSLTLKDVSIILGENAGPAGKTLNDLREVYETRNSRQVVDLLLAGKFKATEKDALKMHALLVRDMGIQNGYKQFPNFLYGRQVPTTLPEKVPSEMNALFEWLAANRKALHPVALAAGFHARFEQIHPFEDGNGRVGRFLVNAILLKAGYPPLIIRKTQRQSYFRALADFDDGRPATLENFLYARELETYEKFFQIYAKYAR